VLLIEDTINFEQKCHLSRISRDRIDVEPSRLWFEGELQNSDDPPSRTHFQIFLRGLFRLLWSKRSIPETFYLDMERLGSIQNEITDLRCLDVCGKIFEKVLEQRRFFKAIPPSALEKLRQCIIDIVRHPDNRSTNQWSSNIDNIAVELDRHALRLCDQVYKLDSDMIECIRCNIQSEFNSDETPLSNQFEHSMLSKLFSTAEGHLNSSPVDMFNALVRPGVPSPPPSHLTCAIPPSPTNVLMHCARQDPVMDVVRRIAHVAVLHWRVWGPIVYARVDNTRLDHMASTLTLSSQTDELLPKGHHSPVGPTSQGGIDATEALRSEEDLTSMTAAAGIHITPQTLDAPKNSGNEYEQAN
jgi:hypothetical protein